MKKSNFSSCTFLDSPDRALNFEGTTWEDVIFKECIFGSKDIASTIAFTHTSFQGVVFDGCTFRTAANILFENFSFSNVEFRNCTFYSETMASLGYILGLTINGSRFLASPEKTGRDEEGNLKFSQVTANRLIIQNSVSEGEIRFQDSAIRDLDIHDCKIGRVACHEEIIKGREAEKTTQLNQTMVYNVSLSDGMYCDQTEFRGLQLQEVKVRNTLDLCKSNIENLAVINVTSLSNETCSEFALCSAEIRGQIIITNVTTTKTTIAKSTFYDAIHLEKFSVLNTDFDLTDTIFSQEKINDECCTESCLSHGCKCDVSLEPLFCPRGNSTVNVNVKDSCFPAMSTVSVVDDSSRIVKTRMRDLRHGHRVLHQRDASATDVYFFGHKTQKQALYKVFTTYAADARPGRERHTLTISPGHLLPVKGRGVLPAREVQTGDALITEEGHDAVVTKVGHEVRQGMYAPTTLSGLLAVDGIRVSCYTEVVPAWLAHVVLAPLRALYGMGGGARKLVGRFNVLHDTSHAWLMDFANWKAFNLLCIVTTLEGKCRLM